MRGAPCLLLAAFVLVSACSTTPDEPEEKTPEQLAVEAREADALARPDDAQAQYALGNAYFDAQRFPDARAAYERAVNIDPRFADAYTNLGLTQRVLGDPSAAIESYRRSLAIDPDDLVTLQNLVIALQSEGRVAEAADPLGQLVERRPDDVALLGDYALTLESLDRFEDAAGVYARIVRLRPDDLLVHYALGRCYFELQRWNDVIGAWRTVVAFDPDFGRAHSGLAEAYFEAGDYDRAWASVRECQRLGAYLDPALISKLQEATGKLGPE